MLAGDHLKAASDLGVPLVGVGRARAGLGLVTVERVDISADPDLEALYGARIPVFAIDDDEADLVTSGRQVREFLQRTIPGPG